MDIMTPAERSKRMSLIRSKWTKQEKIIHGYLKSKKIRHKMHPRMLGNPDIVLKDAKTLIFLHGCFWHKCPIHYREPKSRRAYWVPKIENNVKRDKKAFALLKKDGWNVVRLWEHDIEKDAEKQIEKVLSYMGSGNSFSFEVISDKEKKVSLTYKNKTLNLQLKKKRSFTVLKKLLESYPNYFNIHGLDGILNDPNRAHSDLRNEDGFASFLEERRGKKSMMEVRLNIKNLFEHVRIPGDPKEFVCLAVAMEERAGLTAELKKKIYKEFKGKCNITGIKVSDNPGGSLFLKSMMTASYDHRRPVSKGGSSDFRNWQLVSQLANAEKNKICNSCDGRKCEQCALAYPEHFVVIQPTGQNIKDLRYE